MAEKTIISELSQIAENIRQHKCECIFPQEVTDLLRQITRHLSTIAASQGGTGPTTPPAPARTP